MPRTDGGGTAMMKASWMLCIAPKSWPMICVAFWPCSSRSSKLSKGVKITPEFEALVKVAPLKPAKATASLTPGTSRIIADARWTTASVRSSEAPSGSWMTTIA